MKIAILGWGSLLWQNTSLIPQDQIDETKEILQINPDFPWIKDGPILPVEFCRKSIDGRITLVLSTKYGIPTRVFFCVSRFTDFKLAKRNLALREGNAKEDKIHFLIRNGDQITDPSLEENDANVIEIIKEWFKDKKDLDAILWTGLSSNWEGDFSEESLLDYLTDFRSNKNFEKLVEYFQKAPVHLVTPGRNVFNKFKLANCDFGKKI